MFRCISPSRVKLLADELSIDLLYQKLADGVGLYSGELDLRKLVGQIDFGAVSVTLGMIGFEVYTDGGFLINLGFPEHVDYSRSYVAQAGIFIGRGGFYIGVTPGRAASDVRQHGRRGGQSLPNRNGATARFGPGIPKGPPLCVAQRLVLRRFEGAVAKRKPSRLLDGEQGKELAGQELALLGGSYNGGRG